MHQEFESKGNDLVLLKDLLHQTFDSITSIPNSENFNLELISNPTNNHTWYKVLEMYELFKDKACFKQIVNTIAKLAEQIIN